MLGTLHTLHGGVDKCLLRRFRQLFFQHYSAHRGGNLAVHLEAFQLTLVFGFFLGERVLQVGIHLLGRSKVATQLFEVGFQLLIACTLGNVLFQLRDGGLQLGIGGLEGGPLVGSTLQLHQHATHIVTRLLALVADNGTLGGNHGVHIAQHLAEFLRKHGVLVLLAQCRNGRNLCIGQTQIGLLSQYLFVQCHNFPLF